MLKIYKFFLSNLIFLFISSYIYSQSYNKTVQEGIESILDDEYFNSTLIAVDIYDLTADEFLYRKNENMLLHPASNMKVLTTAAALEFLGKDYEFITSVFHTGIIIDSICYGDIFIVGGLDPDFTTEDLDTLVLGIKKFGIKEIRGNIYGDVSNIDSLFWGNGWMWDDDPSTDSPYMTSLIINDAAIKIAYEPNLIGDTVIYKIIPQTNFFEVINNSLTSRNNKSDLKISRNWLDRGNRITISGNLFYKSTPDTVAINVVNPTYYFLFLFKENLNKYSIKFEGNLDTLTLPEFSTFIYSKKRKFKNVINNLNKESDNLSAEMTLRALSLGYFDKPASASNGIQMIDSLIKIIDRDPKKYKLVDGSGLSHYNLITTDLMIEVLKYFYFESTNNYQVLVESFPIAGVDGTLKNRMKRTKAESNVRAKTGTLSGVSALSGFMKTKNNHNLAFSILIQNFVNSAKNARFFQDEICAFLAELKL